MFLASDVNAIVSYTKQVIYVDDRETILLKKDSYRTTDVKNLVVDKVIEEIGMRNMKRLRRGGILAAHVLRKFSEQPDSIIRGLRGRGRGCFPDFFNNFINNKIFKICRPVTVLFQEYGFTVVDINDLFCIATIAFTSEARNISFSPTPTTRGLPFLAPIISSGNSENRTTRS